MPKRQVWVWPSSCGPSNGCHQLATYLPCWVLPPVSLMHLIPFEPNDFVSRFLGYAINSVAFFPTFSPCCALPPVSLTHLIPSVSPMPSLVVPSVCSCGVFSFPFLASSSRLFFFLFSSSVPVFLSFFAFFFFSLFSFLFVLSFFFFLID